MFGRLRLLDDPKPAIVPPRPPPPPPRAMITYDKGLPSLPDDILCEIFGLLDVESLIFCSLTGKALSCSAKPFIHRTLYLTPRSKVTPYVTPHMMPKTPGPWNELKGLQTLSERGLLHHTRHISISLPRNPLFVHDLEPYIRQLGTITNLRSLKTRWLDVPSFIPKMEECFGGFLGSLRFLELESPRGDHHQILCFACQFPNLRDLKINGLQDYSHSMRNGGPYFEIKTSPPLDGTLDLELGLDAGPGGDSIGAQLFVSNLVTLPSGLRFRTLKLSEWVGNNLQLLVDACAPTLECMELTSECFGRSFVELGGCPLFTLVRTTSLSGTPRCPQLSFKRHPVLRDLEINLASSVDLERAARWLSGTLKTITSNAFTKLTVCVDRVTLSLRATGENYVREWSAVDNVLDRLSLCEDVTLVVRLDEWVEMDKFGKMVEKYFPLMWENGRVNLEVPPPTMRDVTLKRIY